jgi:Tfp pilus assembly protein PilO
MTGRDRIVAMVIAALAILAGAWFLAVAPKREQAAKLAGEVSATQAQLAAAESQVASASSAQAGYQSAYASLVSLGKAVPASQETPSLIYQLAQATNEKNVEFASITATVPGAGTGAASSSASASGASASGASAAAAAAAATFQQLPFTFVFNGSFDSLYNVFRQLDAFARRGTSGALNVSGRLLTIQSVKLAPASESAAAGSGKKGATGGSSQLSGSITATAYVLPAGQSVTGGATPAGPAGASTTTTATASTGSSASSTNAPAVIQVKP